MKKTKLELVPTIFLFFKWLLSFYIAVREVDLKDMPVVTIIHCWYFLKPLTNALWFSSAYPLFSFIQTIKTEQKVTPQTSPK